MQVKLAFTSGDDRGGLIVNISKFALDGNPSFMIPYKQLKERDCYEIYFNLWL
jgi:hypothetical protein